MLRKPAVVGHWLGGARSAQIAVVLLAGWLFWAWPPLLEATLTQLHPPEQRQTRVLGFIPVAKQEVRARVEAQRAWATRVAWGLSGGIVFWLLWSQVRPSAIEAGALSLRREREADELHPGSRKRLQGYRSAHRLALDRGRESMLLRKLAGEAEATPLPTLETGGGHRYRIEEELGRGGMGVVFRAFDPGLGRAVALKRLSQRASDDPDFADSLRKEARALARLSHPHIVQVFDILEEGDGIWIVLELVDGSDVAARLRESGPLTPSETVEIAIQLAEALAYAHSRDVLHRDVKPANVLLSADGSAKLTDFGIAKLIEQDGGGTRTGIAVGSPRYMSPEQLRGTPLDARTDIYSLGITLYEMLTGHVPDRGEGSVSNDVHAPTGAPRPSELVELPPELDRLVMEMAADSPDERPDSMNDVIRRLSSLAKPDAAES
jgi:hypothetical protein